MMGERDGQTTSEMNPHSNLIVHRSRPQAIFRDSRPAPRYLPFAQRAAVSATRWPKMTAVLRSPSFT